MKATETRAPKLTPTTSTFQPPIPSGQNGVAKDYDNYGIDIEDDDDMFMTAL